MFLEFLALKKTPREELGTIRLKVVDEELLPVFTRGRVWCALNLVGHGFKIFIKPLVYLIASFAKLVFSFYECLKGKRSLDDLKQSGLFLVCAILSPFAEAINVCKATAGIILPSLYYRHIAVAMVDATYETDGEGNLDYSYVNPRLRFGFVIDGAGHSNPERKKTQDPIISSFIGTYQESLEKLVFDTIEEAQGFVQEQMNAFGRKFNKALPDSTPAILFTQVIRIGDKRHVLVAHMSDTALYIKTQGRWRMTPRQPDIGFGSNGTKHGEINLPLVECLDVSPGTELIAFTDGIGEFLTESECCAILGSNNDRRSLLGQFKQKIIEKGDEHAAAVGKRGGSEKGEAANGGKHIKFHNTQNAQYYDDISLFSFLVE